MNIIQILVEELICINYDVNVIVLKVKKGVMVYFKEVVLVVDDFMD